MTWNGVQDWSGRKRSSLKPSSSKLVQKTASRRDAAHAHVFGTGKGEQRSGAQGERALELSGASCCKSLGCIFSRIAETMGGHRLHS